MLQICVCGSASAGLDKTCRSSEQSTETQSCFSRENPCYACEDKKRHCLENTDNLLFRMFEFFSAFHVGSSVPDICGLFFAVIFTRRILP